MASQPDHNIGRLLLVVWFPSLLYVAAPLPSAVPSVSSSYFQPTEKTVIINTTLGPVKGVEEKDLKTGKIVHAFYGIPFAQPPTGNNRFRPPQPKPPWKDVIDCTKNKVEQVCPQLDFIGKEDCLYLNIYIPQVSDPQHELPTYFWIYGGGYSIGDKFEFGFYDGKNFATSREIIVIEPNYRLDTLGFLAVPAFKREMNGTYGNYALQDQQFALKFAYENVETLGGTKERLIIAGQSAGAISVCWHLASKESTKYYTSAIMESGSCQTPLFFISENRSVDFGREVTNKVGCDPNAPDAELMTCLRSKDYKSFNMRGKWPIPIPGTNHSIIPPLSLIFPFGPTIDGDERGLVARPIEILGKVNYTHKPLVIGTNKNEGSIFAPLTGIQVKGVKFPLDKESFHTALLHFYNETTVPEIETFYQNKYKTYTEKLSMVLRDTIFLCSSQYASEALVKAGSPVWLYQFIPKLPLWVDYDVLKDYHTLEIGFVFDNEFPPLVHPFGPNEHKLSTEFGEFWINLGKYNDVNGGKVSLAWPRYSLKDRDNMVFNIPKLSTNSFLEDDACEFWRTRTYKFD